jgi:hypothetical protein
LCSILLCNYTRRRQKKSENQVKYSNSCSGNVPFLLFLLSFSSIS